jgi:hypothetical protein
LVPGTDVLARPDCAEIVIGSLIWALELLIFAQLGAAPQAQQAGGLLAQLLGSAEKAQKYVEEFLRRQE